MEVSGRKIFEKLSIIDVVSGWGVNNKHYNVIKCKLNK
jgi:hypothetical protein